jgi:outer membrane receptor protein involved in Fe transport
MAITTHVKKPISFVAGLMLAAASASAFAQAPAKPSPAADENAGGLEEIVVTARKTEEKLQDIPLTVSAFSEEALKNYNVLRVGDLNQLTPGMNYQEGSGRGGAGRFFIRGLTGGVAGTARASTFVDGVYVANSVANILFGEMERAEVLLGPQSAQFGRSTFGGALNLVTKDPKNVWSGSAALSVGTDNERNFDGWIGGPLIEDKLLGSLYVGTQHYGGPGRWTAPPDILHPSGVHQGGTDTKAGALKLVFMPIEGLRMEGRISYTKDHDDPAFSNILLPQYRTAVYQQVRRDCVAATPTTPAVCTPQATSQPAYFFSGTLNPGDAFKGGFPGGIRNYDQFLDPTYRNTTPTTRKRSLSATSPTATSRRFRVRGSHLPIRRFATSRPNCASAPVRRTS